MASPRLIDLLRSQTENMSTKEISQFRRELTKTLPVYIAEVAARARQNDQAGPARVDQARTSETNNNTDYAQ